MQDLNSLAGAIRRIGFSCRRCGRCCGAGAGEDFLVMITPREIRCIMGFTEMRWEEIADPFPIAIEAAGGSEFTFEWCLKKAGEECIFHTSDGCGIYPARPLMCRTYPFVLEGDELCISRCEGVGSRCTQKEALELAKWLLVRRCEEGEELERVRSVLESNPVPGAGSFVIDGEGVKRAHG